jgi:hypothetical protein
VSAPIHWTVAVPDATVKSSKEGSAAWFAAMALAHHRAYGEAITTGEATKEGLRAAVDAHYHPMFAAFSAAALLHGWTPEQVDQAIEDGAAVDEWTWQWLTEAGVPEADIDRITWSLNAPDVVDNHAARA